MEKSNTHPTNERMRQVINFYHGSLSKFGELSGMSRESVSQYLRSDTVSKNMLNAFRIVYPEVNMEWIATGEGNPFGHGSPEDADCTEMVETLIKANQYQANLIAKLYQEKKHPFRMGNNSGPSRIIPSERLREFAQHSQVSFLHRLNLS